MHYRHKNTRKARGRLWMAEQSQDRLEKSEQQGFGMSNKHNLSWNQVEPWQQDNPFITSGYRAATNSYLRSLQSLRYLHNQTVNIWSHLAGAIVYAISAIVLYWTHSDSLAKASAFDLMLIEQFYLTIILCLMFSSAFHTFGNHSDDIYHSFLLCDLVGIILLTIASFFPGVYYGFYCESRTTVFYWLMVRISGSPMKRN